FMKYLKVNSIADPQRLFKPLSRILKRQVITPNKELKSGSKIMSIDLRLSFLLHSQPVKLVATN
ncbi:hypothetical protein AB4458_27035, partial [Vibrio sp. 10N.261.45.F1]|uniref:hypothetical protein n=1 Tax=Vibrio sp. 10N.261.45.F1 TaxID=3229657 RepID=UPI00354E40E4